MDPFDPFSRPGYLLLLLVQGERSLEGHTRLFLEIAHLTSYSDDALCVFYDASLNPVCRAPSSEDGPLVDFAAFVEWILVRNGSPFTICPEDDLTSSTPDPEPSPSSPRCAEPKPEPTDDGEPKPAATDEPSPHGATVLRIAAEQELLMTSDQVQEPATTPATRERAVDSESVERSWGWAFWGTGTVECRRVSRLGLVCWLAPSPPSFVGALCQSCFPVQPWKRLFPSQKMALAPAQRWERAPVPEFSPERAPVPEFGPERASVPKVGPERASVPKIGPERASVPKIAPERASVPEFSPERAPVPELGPERAPVPESSPERARVPKSNTERTSVPKFSPGRASAPVCSPESPEAQKCPPTLPLLPPPLLSFGSPSAHPQPTICSVRATWVCQSPLSAWLENPLPPPTASEPRTPPIDPAAPP